MRGKNTGGLLLLFCATVVGFVLVALRMREQQEQIDALRGEMEGAPRDAATGPEAGMASHKTEEVVVDTLRNIVSAQAMLQQSGKADQDEDGTGEYGGLLEMSGLKRGRMLSIERIPQFPTFEFRPGSGDGTLEGYAYRVYLPDEDGAAVAEPGSGFSKGLVNGELSEEVWCCYAWPLGADAGLRAFFTNQNGDVLFTESARYRGAEGAPPGDAAFEVAGTMTGRVAAGGKGSDGNVWLRFQD